MSTPVVLVTGATGFLGPFVVAELRRVARVVQLRRRVGEADSAVGDPGASDIVAADLTDLEALDRAVSSSAPDFVLHMAAMSRMADCGGDPERARATNSLPAGVIAGRCGKRSLFVSTDLVFDGRSAPYEPLDSVAPLSVYGQTKAEGEELALSKGGRVARLPLLFGPDQAFRGATMMVRRAVEQQQTVTLYTNEYRTPLHARDAARGLVETLFAPDGARLVHLAGPERVSRWELGRRYCALHQLPTTHVSAVECQDAARPRDVSLVSAWQAPRSLDDQLSG